MLPRRPAGADVMLLVILGCSTPCAERPLSGYCGGFLGRSCPTEADVAASCEQDHAGSDSGGASFWCAIPEGRCVRYESARIGCDRDEGLCQDQWVFRDGTLVWYAEGDVFGEGGCETGGLNAHWGSLDGC